ncbi:conserved hypothetical protein [Desulfarculales bacterium]
MEDSRRALQLRVDSCQRLIHDVSQRLAQQTVHPRIVEQLSRLDELLSLIDQRLVNEADLSRIEAATNQLMVELSALFSHKKLGSLYNEVPVH